MVVVGACAFPSRPSASAVVDDDATQFVGDDVASGVRQPCVSGWNVSAGARRACELHVATDVFVAESKTYEDITLVDITVAAEGFDRLIAGFDSAPLEMRRAMLRPALDALEIVYVDARFEKVPQRTGRLANAIGARLETSGAEWIGGVGVRMSEPPYGDVIKSFDTAPYAASVEEGAEAHEIVARGRKRGGKDALWSKGYFRHPVRRVHHPGQPGQHFLRNALTENVDKIRDKFRESVQEALGRIKDGGA